MKKWARAGCLIGLAVVMTSSSVWAVPELGVTPPFLTIGASATSGVVKIWNRGDGVLSWSITSNEEWLSVGQSSGSNDPNWANRTEVPVYVDRTGLAQGTYAGELAITSNGGNGTCYVTMHVQIAPMLSLGQSVIHVSLNHPSGTLTIRNGGVETLTWSVGGIVGLYADPQGTNCNIVHSGPGLLPVYVVHSYTDGATAMQFAAPKPACWTNATYLSDTDPYPVTIGNSQTGKAVPYGTCLSGSIQATTINYFVQDPPGEPCCIYPVLPDPNVPSGQIEMVHCDNTLGFALGGYAVIHPDASCMCARGTVSAEETTWGRIKSLYAPE
jgi:hypothetical protein